MVLHAGGPGIEHHNLGVQPRKCSAERFVETPSLQVELADGERAGPRFGFQQASGGLEKIGGQADAPAPGAGLGSEPEGVVVDPNGRGHLLGHDGGAGLGICRPVHQAAAAFQDVRGKLAELPLNAAAHW